MDIIEYEMKKSFNRIKQTRMSDLIVSCKLKHP